MKNIVHLIIFFLTPACALKAQCTFSTSNSSPCAGEEITFNVDNPSSDANYSWDIDGDGNTDVNGSSFNYEFPVSLTDTSYQIDLYENDSLCFQQLVDVNAIPDISIKLPPGSAIMIDREIRACSGSGEFELRLLNSSQTFAENVSYTINWGDDSSAETYDNSSFSDFTPISHTYTRLGYFTIFISIEHTNGCIYTDNYTFYNGGNPSVGLVNPGNTVGLCAPATLNFPITNTENNPPGTSYMILVNGEVVDTFNQDNVPEVYTYTFEENSCGQETTTGNYVNSYDLQIIASNPCNSSAATIEPIEVTARPTPGIEIATPINICAGEEYTLRDLTEGVIEVISGNPSSCLEVLDPTWSISGTANEDWVLRQGSLFGSPEVVLEFLEPGVYTIELTIVSFSCGPLSVQREITIFDPPELEAQDTPFEVLGGGVNGDECAPLQILFPDVAKGDSLNFEWEISPDTGWEFLDSTNAQSRRPIVQFNDGGHYDISARVTNPCSSRNWNGAIDVPGPPTAQIGPLPDFCNTAVLNFDSTNLVYFENGSPIRNVSWTFTGSNTPIDTAFFPTGIQYDSFGLFYVELYMENACGNQTVIDSFNIQQPTDLEMPPDTTVCSNSEIIPLKAMPFGGTWSGMGVTNGNLFNPHKASIGANVITYSFGVGACFMEDSFTITVTSAPTVNAGPDEELCSLDNPVTLSATPGNGQWITPLDTTSGDFLLDPGMLPPGHYDYFYQVSSDNGCAALDTVHVNIKPNPNIIVTDTSYCNTPGTVGLPIANLNGSWSGAGVVDPTGSFDPFVAGGAGVYTLSYFVQGSNGCDATANVSVGVIDPTKVNAGTDITLCENDEVYDLTARATPPGGSWMSTTNGLQNGQFNPTVAGGGQFEIVYRVGQGNCKVYDTLQITVIPAIPIDAGPNEQLCIDNDIINLSPSIGANGTWSGPGITNQRMGTFSPNRAGTGVHQLTYTILDASTGCSSIDTRQVTVDSLPIARFEVPSPVCTGTTVALNSEDPATSGAIWQISDGRQFSDTQANLRFNQSGDYDIQLIVENQFGCYDSTSRSIQIVAPPMAQFDLPEDEACVSLDLIPINESTGFQNTYQWDFGNGTTVNSTTISEPITYNSGINDTTYFIQLLVENQCGIDTYQDSVFIKASPKVDFGFSQDTACAPAQIFFNNVSQGNVQSFEWDFGNGFTSTDSLPGPQSYFEDTIAVDYLVTLIGLNECGVDTVSKPITIEPQNITSFFNVSNLKGCAPFTISLEDFSTPHTRIYWDFGDGFNSSERNPTHTFFEPGQYSIRQYTSNACAMDSSFVNIEVLPSPSVDFDHTKNLCTDQEIQFDNLSPSNTNSLWIFNDLDSSTVTHPTFVFPATGTFPVKLIVEDRNNGCITEVSKEIVIESKPDLMIQADVIQGCTPLTTRFTSNSSVELFYEWQFGDGNSSTNETPTHTFTEPGTFTATVLAMDQKGCIVDTSIFNIQAYPIPIASFEIEDSIVCGVTTDIKLINTSEGAAGYQWLFGNGQTSSFMEPIFKYDQSGRYGIQLNVENLFGCKDSTVQSITIIEQPVSDFGLEDLSGCSPFTAEFQNYALGETYFWEFGDGQTSTEKFPDYTYEQAGQFDVSLIVGNSDLCFDTLTLNSLVSVWQTPIASFEWEDQNPDKPDGRINFLNSSMHALTYRWEFGDGTASDAVNPEHRYFVNDIYAVQLEAFGEQGCKDDTTIVIEPAFFGKLFVPNAFAPLLGKGEAQIFLPKGNGLKEYHLQIFSAYGELLWETFDLQDGQPSIGWDGTFNGIPLPQDTYVWKVYAVFEDGTQWKGNKTVSGKYQKMGSVTLLR